MPDCIFCKIIKGEIPCNKVYEDETTIAFLDINPATKKGGHTLVLPKKHFKDIEDIPEDLLNKTMNTIKKISKAVLKEAEGVNILQNNKKIAGQFVMHVHFHIIPRYKNDGITIEKWPQKKYGMGEAEQVTERIKNLLK